MKRSIGKSEADTLVSHLLRDYSIGIHRNLQENDPSPFFLSRLQARIREQKQVSQVWEFGVLSARKWLIALSFIALLFFFGNLVLLDTQSHLIAHHPVQSSQNEPEDSEDIHSEALNVDMLQKE